MAIAEKVAGEPGFEPGLTESESVGLPLTYSPFDKFECPKWTTQLRPEFYLVQMRDTRQDHPIRHQPKNSVYGDVRDSRTMR